jgi:hypothetical protein
MPRSLSLLLAVLLLLLGGVSSGDPRRVFDKHPHDPELLLNAAPQGEHLFLSWNANDETSYRIRWRETGTARWTVVHAGRAATYALRGLTDFVSYDVELQAIGERGRIRRSAVTRATPRPRSGCAAVKYIPWELRMNFFCSWRQLDLYLVREGIDASRLRCRNQPVSEWNEAAPDCLYELPNGDFALLLRAADDTFQHPVGYRDPAAVSRVARRAMWRDSDPFAPGAPSLPVHAIPAITGRVLHYVHAESQRIETGPETSSRITWFTPFQARAGRYAIYHEGHGGAATDIAAETIGWLLARGWTVVAMDMPLVGANVVDVKPGLAQHFDFDARDDGATSPLANFLLPVKTVVDSIVERAGAGDPEVLLIGRSGGGWTTYVYGALDPRVDVVVSVAGGTPLSVRLIGRFPFTPALELGDYEQSWPALYSIVRHEDLMIAAGARGSLHIYNEFDGCCYRVRPDDAFVPYLRGASQALGKKIDVFVDRRNPQHSIGPAGYERLELYLNDVFGR